MNVKPIVALDFPTFRETVAFLQYLPHEPLFVKVGMELFYRNGLSAIEELHEVGHDIFLDLKLHDIPNTVKSAMKVLAQTGVAMLNVHCAGGRAMMEAAREGVESGSCAGRRPKLIAGTQLTSTTEQAMHQDQGIEMSLIDSVLHYSRNAYESGLDGVVCSAHEAALIKEETHPDFLCVTPGIRLATDELHEQKRVMTPLRARQNGANYIVVGRSITQAQDPLKAYLQVLDEWQRGAQQSI